MTTPPTPTLPVWFNCLLLKNRSLTTYEMERLKRVNVQVVVDETDVVIGPKDSPLSRPMHVTSTHYHHLDALLAILVCYVDPSVKHLNGYPVRRVRHPDAQ